jgi:ankyrin repeat protein
MSKRSFSLVVIVFSLVIYPACTKTSTNSSSTAKTSPSSAANSPLMVAVKGGQTDSVKALLSGKDVDVNMVDADGNTPLIEAARFGHDEIARLLIAHGADLQAKNKDGDTALMLAVRNGHQDVVKVLTEAGAK